MKNQILAIIFIVSFFSFGFSQQWTTYSEFENTTVIGDINEIKIDQNGTQWYASSHGLTKYDGTNFTFFPTINNPFPLTDIVIDSQNNIWATSINRILKFDGQNITEFATVYNTSSIAIDSNDNLWIGTSNGIVMFDGTNWINYMTGSTNENMVNDLEFDNQGNLWVATHNGIVKYDGNNWNSIVVTDPNSPIADVSNIKFDNQGIPYFNVNGNILIKVENLVQTEITICSEYQNQPKGNFLFDLSNNLWIGTQNGLIKFDGLNCEFFPEYTSVLLVDNNNHLYVGSNSLNILDFAIFEYDGITFNRITPFYIGNPMKNISSPEIHEDSNGSIYLISKEPAFGNASTIFKYDQTNWTLLNYTLGAHFRTIDIDSNNNIWSCFDNGISKFDGDTLVNYLNTVMIQTPPESYPTSSLLKKDARGNFWYYSIYRGFVKFDGNNWTTIPFEYSSANCIAFDMENNLWVGTNNGVYLFDGTIWTHHYTVNNGLIDNNVLSISVDMNNKIWVGTTNGISRFDLINWTSFSTILGNTNITCSGIQTDSQNNTWFATNYGLLKFNNSIWSLYSDNQSPVIGNLTIDRAGNKWILQDFVLKKYSDGGAGPFLIDYNIKGYVFNDLNGNGIKESNESYLPDMIIKVDSNYCLTQNDGSFYRFLTNGNHSFILNPPLHWENTTSDTINISMPYYGDTILFGVKALDNIHDIKVTLVGSKTKANFQANHWINYKNVGTIIENGIVEIELDTAIIFISSIPTPTSISNNILSWNYSNLEVNEYQQIHIITQMPNVDHLGDTLVNIVNIDPTIEDVYIGNNVDTLFQVLIGSYDPNDKTVHQGVLDEKYVLFDQTLDYTIRFQNTGTDTALMVNVYDTISSHMDMSTFQLLGTSHPCQIEIRNNNLVVFHFYDILLPDSNVNQLGSNGFIQYGISPKDSLDENTVVNNTGYIYFDYNPAIITNTAFNTYVSVIPSAVAIVEKIQKDGISIYPNPTQGNVTFDLGKIQINVQIKITDFQGREVKQLKISNSQFIDIDLNETAEGVYFIMVKSEEMESTFKVIKQ